MVWRCDNRLNNGTKYCKKSESIEEGALNRAVMEAIQKIACNNGKFIGAFRQNGVHITNSGMRIMECELAWVSPAALKGKKPIALKFASGENVPTPTWKKVVLTIMKHCNEQPGMHESLMQLRGKITGRQRVILGQFAEEMDVPIRIDEDLYFEGKFDTGVLLTMMAKKVLEPIGYDITR